MKKVLSFCGSGVGSQSQSQKGKGSQKKSHLLKQFPSPLTSRTKASPSSNLSLEHSEIFRSKYIYIIMLSAQPIVKFFFLLLSREDFVVLRGGLLLWTTTKKSEGWCCSWQWPNKKQRKIKEHSNSFKFKYIPSKWHKTYKTTKAHISTIFVTYMILWLNTDIHSLKQL